MLVTAAVRDESETGSDQHHNAHNTKKEKGKGNKKFLRVSVTDQGPGIVAVSITCLL